MSPDCICLWFEFVLWSELSHQRIWQRWRFWVKRFWLHTDSYGNSTDQLYYLSASQKELGSPLVVPVTCMFLGGKLVRQKYYQHSSLAIIRRKKTRLYVFPRKGKEPSFSVFQEFSLHCHAINLTTHPKKNQFQMLYLEYFSKLLILFGKMVFLVHYSQQNEADFVQIFLKN